MVLFGLDISHHQGSNPPMGEAAAHGVNFCICKATEGDGFVDRMFHNNIARASAAGMLVAAYHYQRSGISAAAQVEHVRRVVPRGMPVIPDVEANSGSVDLTREIVRLLRAAGYPVPLTYLPRWYWQQIGRPSLAGLPPLWSSRYPDNTQGSIADEYADVPASYWDGYGGLPVALLQFSSSGRVANYGPLDLNAYRGTRAELAALLGGQPTQEDDMFDPDTHGNALASMHEGMFYPLAPGKDRSKFDDILDKVTALTALVAQQANVTAEDIAAALRAGLASDVLPVLQEVLADALDDDNGQQAEAISTAVLTKLGEKLGGAA